MKNKNILISGAGIAGPALAYWLCRYGFNPTVVERFPKIREGGYVIDFWGAGYDAAEKMGILDKLKSLSYSIEEIVFLGGQGEVKGKIQIKQALDVIDRRLISFLRSDLSRVLYDKTKGQVDYIFGDEIASLAQRDAGVDVVFKNRGAQTFDLVIGADGLHSKVRSLAFGPLSNYERYLGYYVASFTTDNFLGDKIKSNYSMYSIPDKQAAVYSLRP